MRHIVTTLMLLQSQDTYTTLKYHTILIKDIQKDAAYFKDTIKNIDNMIDNINVKQINSRLNAIDQMILVQILVVLIIQQEGSLSTIR